MVGARPQFIKASAVSRAFESIDGWTEVLVHTGQHYDDSMSNIFFEELGIPRPKHNLGVGSGPHGRQTARMLEGLEEILMAERPDWVLVYGDTNSTLAAAVAAAKLHIPLAHVEAGLRNYDRRMPEEINRVLTDQVSDRLYTPTAYAVECLRREGVSAERIRPVGDVMYDVALFFRDKALRESRILDQLGLTRGTFTLATIHRAENTDDEHRLRTILEALAALARETTVVLPLHPRTRAVLNRVPSLVEASRGIRIIDPVGYLDITMLRQAAQLVVTDSGGLQKEAFFDRVPCVVLYQATPWVELVELGWVTVVAVDDARTLASELRAALGRRGRDEEPYGAGDAAHRIIADLTGAAVPAASEALA